MRDRLPAGEKAPGDNRFARHHRHKRSYLREYALSDLQWHARHGETELPRTGDRNPVDHFKGDVEGRVAVLMNRILQKTKRFFLMEGTHWLNLDGQLLAGLLNDLELAHAFQLIEEMGEELAMQELARWRGNDIGAAPFHDIHQRQAAPAATDTVAGAPQIAHLVANQRHGIIVQVGDGNHALFAWRHWLAIAQELGVVGFGQQVQALVMVALVSNIAHLPAAIAVKDFRAKGFLDQGALRWRQNLGGGLDAKRANPFNLMAAHHLREEGERRDIADEQVRLKAHQLVSRFDQISLAHIKSIDPELIASEAIMEGAFEPGFVIFGVVIRPPEEGPAHPHFKATHHKVAPDVG